MKPKQLLDLCPTAFKRTLIQVRLSSVLVANARVEAKKRGLKMTDVIKAALIKFIEECKT